MTRAREVSNIDEGNIKLPLVPSRSGVLRFPWFAGVIRMDARPDHSQTKYCIVHLAPRHYRYLMARSDCDGSWWALDGLRWGWYFGGGCTVDGCLVGRHTGVGEGVVVQGAD